MMSDSVKAKRRTVFIKRRFQMKFVVWVIGLLVLCCLCSAAVLYPLLSSELNSQWHAGHHSADAAGGRLVLAIAIGNLLAIIVAALAAAVVILYISHKIAGPLYRFERICEQVGQGDLEGSPGLRQTDQLKGLSEAFGGMLRQLRDRRDGRRARLDTLEDGLKTLRDTLPDTPPVRSALASFGEQLASLRHEVDEAPNA